MNECGITMKTKPGPAGYFFDLRYIEINAYRVDRYPNNNPDIIKYGFLASTNLTQYAKIFERVSEADILLQKSFFG